MADNTQREMNSIYTSIVELYQREMAKKLNRVGILKHNRRSLKSWWNENYSSYGKVYVKQKKQSISKDNSNPDTRRRLRMICKDKPNRFVKESVKLKEHINNLSEMNSYKWKKTIQKHFVQTRYQWNF